MRRAGSVPYSWLSDNSRSYFHVQQYQGLEDALHRMQEHYRRDLWLVQPFHVEIWLEKRALVGQLLPICNEYGVKLFPCGGYSSISFASEAAAEWETIDKPIYIYHLSDFDADGVYSSVALERELRLHTLQPFVFQRLALDEQQLIEYELFHALRPQKTTSKRYKWWFKEYGKSMACELDALHPDDLRQIVRDTIEKHIDRYELTMTRKIEKEERETLAHIIESLNGHNGQDAHTAA
jgi:hypothetical protein